MERLVASNGLEIMRTYADFDYSKYRLLKESLEPIAGTRMVRVTETYGYTPSITIRIPSQISWTRPGYTDTSSGGVSRSLGTISNDATAQIHTINIANTDNVYNAGDLIKITAPYYSTGGTSYWRQNSGAIVILTASTTQITIGAFPLTMYYNDGSIAGTLSSFDAQSSMLQPFRAKVATTYASSRTAYSADFSGIREIKFLTQSPTSFTNSVEPFSVTKAGAITDTLDATTIPSVSAYKAAMAAGNFLIPSQQQLEQIMGDVYAQTTFYLPYQ